MNREITGSWSSFQLLLCEVALNEKKKYALKMPVLTYPRIILKHLAEKATCTFPINIDNLIIDNHSSNYFTTIIIKRRYKDDWIF